MTPGKRPHSATPRKNRAMRRPVALLTVAIHIMIPPHATIMKEIQRRGPATFRHIFENTSNSTYLFDGERNNRRWKKWRLSKEMEE